MLIAKESKEITTKENIDEKLISHFKSKVSSINVVSFFYNTPEIFKKIIFYALSQNKTVLYITNESENHVFLASILKSQGIKCNYLGYKLQQILKQGLNIINHNQALYLEEKFDLVIYDDINSMPVHGKESIRKLLESCCKGYGTMIAYSIEPVFYNEVTLFQCPNNNGKPLVEPRIINTRVNVNDDLPQVVYDYLNWSILSDKKVVIYVPDNEKVENIYNYLIRFRNKLTRNIFNYKSDEKHNRSMLKFLAKAKGIMITNSFENGDVDLTGINVMVFFAEHKIFDYKRLVYLSSRASRSKSLDRGEVIFLSNELSEDMDNAKEILRELNKKAWEAGFLRL